MSEGEPRKRSWALRKRLEYIDFRLFWYGRFVRQDLADAFEMSPQQASADVAEYMVRAPDNLIYDAVAKAYVRAPTFSPKWAGEFADRYLLQLVAVDHRWLDRSETWFTEGFALDVELSALQRPRTNADHLLALVSAMQRRHELQVDYRSMMGTPPDWQTIAPHSLHHCAGRWYVRSWSQKHNDFRDYSIHRIKGVAAGGPASVDVRLDYEWEQSLDLVIVPNPNLEEDRRQAVIEEWEMTDGALRLTTRLARTFYLMAEHNLDVEDGVLKPEKQQLVLANREDVEGARRYAREMSKQALARAAHPK